MTDVDTTTTFDYVSLFVENVAVWELMVLAVLVWLVFKPEFLNRVTRIKLGDLELDVKNLKSEIEENRNELRILEDDIEYERRTVDELLQGFDVNAPVTELGRTRELLRAEARNLSDFDEVKQFLSESASPEQLFAAAVNLRERRPTSMLSDLLDCLDRLAAQPELGGIRLNTVWTLTSALHRILIAGIRDGVQPSFDPAELRRAESVLDRLDKNPRVQADRSDAPDKGVRGPIRFAQNWARRGLATAG